MFERWYHGTSKEYKESILKEGFKAGYGRFGEAVYFSNSIEGAKNFGSEIIEVFIEKKNSISLNYESLAGKYPWLSIDEQEGVPEFKTYITEELNHPSAIIMYDEDDKELCVYDSNIIETIKEPISMKYASFIRTFPNKTVRKIEVTNMFHYSFEEKGIYSVVEYTKDKLWAIDKFGKENWLNWLDVNIVDFN